MAYITSQNNIRYALDNLQTETYGILFTKTGSELDFTGISSISGINLNFSKPGNSQIFIAFNISNTWCVLSSSGNIGIFSDTTPDINMLKTYGMTPEQLQAVTFWDNLVQKKVGLAIGLYTTDKNNAIPKIKLSFNVLYPSQLLTYSELSPVFDFEEPVTIADFSYQDETASGGSAVLYARADLSDGEKFSYTDLNNLKGKTITQLQYKADYHVPEIGAAYARINNVNMIYSLGSAKTSGVTSGEIISITQNWFMNISQVRMNVKHGKLINAKITAQCTFRREPSRVSGEILGTGNGGKITFALANSRGLKYDTIKLYYDNQRVYSDFEFNTQSGRVTCDAPQGSIVSCDYEYNWENETWHDMTLATRYELDDIEVSEFRLSTTEKNKSVSAVKVILEMTEGKITNEKLGKGTGISQTYKLTHHVKDGAIKIYSNGSALSTKNWYLLEDTQYVRISATNGASITASYDWISESPEVYQIAAVYG